MLTSLTSHNKSAIVKIESGELISYLINNEELIHQKGNPGWEKSDIEMFPIIGPTSTNNNKVFTQKGKCIQSQHGFLRELKYFLVNNSETKAIFNKTYKANTQINNSRFPENSNEPYVFWNYDFTFSKSFELFDDSLLIQFELKSEKGMPFMFGYHPAFKLSGNFDEIIKLKNQNISIENVIQKGGAAYPFFDVNEITLTKKEGYNIHLKTEGFNNIMFWTEVKNMICIEPITQYPNLKTQSYSSKNMRISKGKEVFLIIITPFKD